MYAIRSYYDADGSNHFDQAARAEAQRIQNEMAQILDTRGFKDIN